MKKIILSLTFLFSMLSCNELDWVNEQVQAIKPARVGLNKKALYGLKNPFVFTKIKKVKTEEVPLLSNTATKVTNSIATVPNPVISHKKFNLSMIMNKSAMINNKWYKVGDLVSGYKITQIEASSVILQRNKTLRTLSTGTVNKNIIFKNK